MVVLVVSEPAVVGSWEGPELLTPSDEGRGSVNLSCLDVDVAGASAWWACRTTYASSGPLDAAWGSRLRSLANLSLPG